MPSDYTIIMWVRHRFGVDEHSHPDKNDPYFVLNEDADAPFVGLVGEFPFICPDVDSTQGAVLEFEYRGSTQWDTFPVPDGDPDIPVGITPEYPVMINNHLVAGGVPGAPISGPMHLPLWSTRALLVDPYVLQEENVLRIESSVEIQPGVTVEASFTIDNVLIHYKTKTGHSRPVVGGATTAAERR
jgi:hypothetical protein